MSVLGPVLSPSLWSLSRSLAPAGQPLSPPIARRPSPPAAADMWALGCLLYEMCASRPLFCGSPGCATATSALAAVRQQVLRFCHPPQLPPLYSAELSAVLTALLRPSPAQRPSAAELLAMPAVAARLAALPQAVQAQLAQAAQRPRWQAAWGSPTGGCLQCSPLPLGSCSAAELNACMPPAAYPDGSPGLLDKLSSGQRHPKRGRALWRRSSAAGQRPASASSRGSSASVDSERSAGVLSLASLDLAAPSSPLASPGRSRSSSPRAGPLLGPADNHGIPSAASCRSRLHRSSCAPALCGGECR